MSDYPTPNPGQQGYQPPPSNGLGVSGFIVSITGAIVTAGFLCPIGFVLSAIALRKEPRGFAIAGTIIGLLGSILAAGVTVMLVNAFNTGMGFFGNFGPQMTTSTTMSIASYDIDSHYTSNNNTLPDQATGDALVAAHLDGWNTPIKYQPVLGSTTDYELVSAGPDMQFGTSDDYTEQHIALASHSHGFPPPQNFAIDNAPDQKLIDFPFEQASQLINSSYPAGSTLPNEATGTAAITSIVDAWRNPMRYAPTGNPPYYHLKSAGKDGQWDTSDDIIKSYYFEPTGTP